MIGQRAVITQATHTGSETILGRVTQTLEEEHGITHVTVEGHIAHETIHGLPLPIEARTGEPVTMVMIPLTPKHARLLQVEILA